MRSYALSPGAMRAPTDRSQTLPAGPQGAAPASRRPARTVPAPRPSAASRPVPSQPSTAQRCPHPTLPLEPSRSLQAAGRDGHKGLGGRIVPAPRSLPGCRSGFPGLRRAAVSVLSPGSPPRCRPRGPAADSRPGFRPRFPSSGPGRLSPQRPAALPHCGEPPPPHLPRRPRSPTWPLAAAPRLPSAHRSLLPPRHGPAAEPSPGEAPLLPPVPTPPRLPAGGAAAARPRRRQGAARPHPAAGPAAAERGALRLGEGERSAITDRFPKTADCRVTVTVPHCFICLWRGLFLNLCPSEAPIPLIS